MIYLDNAATTMPNPQAVRRAEEFLTEKWYNPSSLYKEGFSLQSELKKARLALLSPVADPADFELVFTSCGSESDNQAVFEYGRRGNIVTTMGEHSAVYVSVTEQKNRGVAEARFAPLRADGTVDAEELLKLVDNKTSLVSVIHVNNEMGAINDINAIARAVKAKNPHTVFHADGVQAYGKLPFRLDKAVDLYSVSAHKIDGLKGTGCLIKNKALALKPYIFGGGQENGGRSGTENTFGIKVFEYAAEERFKTLREDFERLKKERERLWTLLDKDIYCRISSPDTLPNILCISAPGLRGEVLLHMANDAGLIVGAGSACSSHSKIRYSRVMQAIGIGEIKADGILRLSFSNHTTGEELTAAAEILNTVGRELQQRICREKL